MDGGLDVYILDSIFPLGQRGAGITRGPLHNLRIQPVGFWVQGDQLGWIIKQKTEESDRGSCHRLLMLIQNTPS